MKKIKALFTITMAFLTMPMFSQKLTDYKHTTSDSIKLAIDVADFHEKKINGMQYCFENFHKSYFEGVATSLTGASVTVALCFYNNGEFIKEGSAIGGVISLVGFIMTIDSFKWLKRAGINPAEYGVGFKVNLP